MNSFWLTLNLTNLAWTLSNIFIDKYYYTWKKKIILNSEVEHYNISDNIIVVWNVWTLGFHSINTIAMHYYCLCDM